MGEDAALALRIEEVKGTLKLVRLLVRELWEVQGQRLFRIDQPLIVFLVDVVTRGGTIRVH